MQKVKIQKLQGQTTEECFYQHVQCVMVKNQNPNLANKKKLVDH